MPEQPRCFSYVRFSSGQQAEGHSRERQIAAAARWAKLNGLELDTDLTFEDLGVSAFRGANADVGALGAFVRAAESGLVPAGSFLLVENLDRLSRQSALVAAAKLQEICSYDVAVVTLMDGRTYTSEALIRDPASIILAVVTFIRAHEESLTKSDRMAQAWEAKREAAKAEGRPMTTWCPAWLRQRDGEFEIVPGRGEIVRRIFDRYLSGHGVQRIASDLNADGVPTFTRDAGGREARQWYRSYTARLLGNPAVVGTLTTGGEEVPGFYPPVIDPETWEAVQAARQARSPGTPADRTLQNLFGGLLTCHICGGGVYRVGKGPERDAWLMCSLAHYKGECEGVNVRYSAAESWFLIQAGTLIAEAPTGEDLRGQIESARGAVLGLEGEIGHVVDAIASVGVSAALEAKLRELEGEQRAAEARLGELEERAEHAESRLVRMRLAALTDALEREPLDRALVNVALRQCVREIVVQPDRLIVHWRHGGESESPFAD
jgi:DNA invertase Pin-like site-specific DNA recombinase